MSDDSRYGKGAKHDYGQVSRSGGKRSPASCWCWFYSGCCKPPTEWKHLSRGLKMKYHCGLCRRQAPLVRNVNMSESVANIWQTTEYFRRKTVFVDSLPPYKAESIKDVNICRAGVTNLLSGELRYRRTGGHTPVSPFFRFPVKSSPLKWVMWGTVQLSLTPAPKIS